jgi:perosamine synthetase
MGEEEVRAVSAVAGSGRLSQGKKVCELEKRLAEYFGVKGAVVTNAGTSALHLGLMAMEINKEDEVILPSYLCTAPLNAVYMAGAVPVLCDIELETFNLSYEDIKDRLSNRTKAVIAPHMFGNVVDINKIASAGIKIIEDCAHSAGAFYGRRKAGSVGEFSVISFYTNKIMAAGEGGAVLSDNENLLRAIRDTRDYDEKEVYKVRFNYKMTDLQAAIALVQLSKLDSFIAMRKSLASVYKKGLSHIDAVLPEGEFDHIFYRYVIRIKKSLPGIIDKLRQRGIIAARPVYKPLHRYFEERVGFKQTDEAFETSLSLPIYPALSAEEQKIVINAVNEIFG